MKSRRAFRALLIASTAVLGADVITQAVADVIWPVHTPAWTLRAWSIGWLAAVLLTGAAGLIYLRQKRQES